MAGVWSSCRPADPGRSMDSFRYGETFLGPLFTNLLTLAGLWTLFGMDLHLICGHSHKPADPSRSMDTFRYSGTNLLTLAGLWTLFGMAEAGVTNLQTLAGLWTLFGMATNCPYTC